jgi:Protein of unknown function (DUF2530)
MARPSRPAPPPLQVDTAKVVLAGTALWAVALVVLLLLGDRVDRSWTWTCVAGIVLAGLGFARMRWQGQIGPRNRRDDAGGGARPPGGPQSERTSNSEVS